MIVRMGLPFCVWSNVLVSGLKGKQTKKKKFRNRELAGQRGQPWEPQSLPISKPSVSQGAVVEH